MRNVISFVLGGGRGTRLYPLTKYRSKPAVPLAAKYRLIDIPLSNCLNSGFNQMYVLTQFLSVSLHRHIRQTYRFDHFGGGYVEILAAQQTMDEGATDWYQGTADAVRKQLRYIQQPGIDYVLILSGDQIFRMDFREMLLAHQRSHADVTIAVMPVNRQASRSLGVLRVDQAGRVVGFLEKPQNDEDANRVRMDPAWIDAQGVPSRGREFLASMGIYLFNRSALVDALIKTDYADFGKEVFPALIRSRKVHAHLFDGYWEDVGTIRSYYEANLAMATTQSPFEMAHPDAPIYSLPAFLPATQIESASVRNSLIADGCHIGDGAVIENSVIGLRCLIGRGATIRNSIIMGSDDYESPRDKAANQAARRPNMGIGDGALIEGAILDKNCRIGRNARIINEQGLDNSVEETDCMIRDGIPMVVKDATIADGWRL